MAKENVRIDYYTASWCGPCRLVRPIIQELKAAGWNIDIIDADQDKDKALVNSVFGIPTFIIYKNGLQVNRFSGARTKPELLVQLNRAAG